MSNTPKIKSYQYTANQLGAIDEHEGTIQRVNSNPDFSHITPDTEFKRELFRSRNKIFNVEIPTKSEYLLNLKMLDDTETVSPNVILPG